MTPNFSAALLKAASKDKNRTRQLGGIFHYRDGWAYATDGHRMHGELHRPPVGETNTVYPLPGRKEHEAPAFFELRQVMPKPDPLCTYVMNGKELRGALEAVKAFHRSPERKVREKEIRKGLAKLKYPGRKAKPAEMDAYHAERKRLYDLLKPYEPNVVLRDAGLGPVGILRVGTVGEDFAATHHLAEDIPTQAFPISKWNVQYLLDALALFPKKARIALQAPADGLDPLLITSPDHLTAGAVVMPIRL